MSDLHQAVQAEIDAYTPGDAPPFDALVRRNKARGRRRLAAGGTALAAVAVVAGVAVVPTLSGRPDKLPGGLAAAATADGPNPQATTVRGVEVASTGPADVTGAWTDPEDPTALFVYAGRDAAPDHCTDHAAVRVVEQDKATVVLDADRYEPAAPPPPGGGCEQAAIYPPAQHRLDLGVPLGGRRVVDTDGRVIEVLDGGELLVPTALPDGYRLPGRLRVGTVDDPGNDLASHVYAGPDDQTYVMIHQGLPSKVPGSDEPVPPSVVLDRPVVRGHPAVVTVTAGLDDLTCLRWRESQDLTVSVCSLGAPAPLSSDELQAVAASLRQARDATN